MQTPQTSASAVATAEQAIESLQAAWAKFEEAQREYQAIAADVPLPDSQSQTRGHSLMGIQGGIRQMARSHQELIAALQQAQLARHREG